jgi:hypothetical protein
VTKGTGLDLLASFAREDKRRFLVRRRSFTTAAIANAQPSMAPRRAARSKSAAATLYPSPQLALGECFG